MAILQPKQGKYEESESKNATCNAIGWVSLMIYDGL